MSRNHLRNSVPVERYLTVQAVAEIYRISTHDVYRKARCGELPQPIKLGPRTTRWRASEIQAHLESLAERR